MTATTHPSNLDRAIERLHHFFRDRRTKEAALARMLSRPLPDDGSLIEHLVRERRRVTRMDGSVGGSLVKTAWLTWELLELGCPPDHAAVVRTLGYVLSRQDRPGHAFEGCSDDRHVQKRCVHFVSGLFSPAPRDEIMAPLTFPSGVVIAGEEEARLAASCLSLRVALRAGEDRRESVRRHLDSLVVLTEEWQPGADGWPPDLVLFVIAAFSLAPREYRAHASELVQRFLGLEDPAGGWRDTETFHALDALLAFPDPRTIRAIKTVVPMLCRLQQENGAFGEAEQEFRALVGLRALVVAQELKAIS